LLRAYLVQALIIAGICLAASLGYLAVSSHYLPHGHGFRFPAANLTYPDYTTPAFAPIWAESSFSECFYSRADDLGLIQIRFYSYLEHRRPPAFWTLEDMDSRGAPAVVRGGPVPAVRIHDYSFVRLRFDPIARSAGKLYRFTLNAPETPYRDSAAVPMYATNDQEATAAQRACGTDWPSYSVLFDKSRVAQFENIPFRSRTTVSQVFTPRQAFMTSVQIQTTVIGAPKDQKLHWNIVRVEDRALIGSGDLSAASLEDWHFADLFLSRREPCYNRRYKLTIDAPDNLPNEGAAVGVPIFPLNGSIVTVGSATENRSRDGFSAHLVVMDSQATRGLRIFDPSSGDPLPRDEYLSANMMLWYFPTILPR
jgi:hypothetical protein